MVVDVKKLIAAINPDIYCEKSIDAEGKKLSEIVKEIAKKEGYLKAAEKAKLIECDELDVMITRFSKGAFSLAGLKSPVEKHTLIYDASSQDLESIYYWILDEINKEYGSSEKLVDNFISSVGSGHFSEMQSKATRMQEEAMKIFGTINTVMRSILNLIYDLKEFKIRLALYDDLKSTDNRKKTAALISLKQIWIDSVDIKRGTTSIKGLSNQFEYVTLIDAFITANSTTDVENIDLNERVKRIVLQRIEEFNKWIKESEQELRKRFEIEKIYLRSQVNSIKIYTRWLKPYLKAAKNLEQNMNPTADIVNSFNTAMFELVLLAKGKYDPENDIASGELPKSFRKRKLRNYYPLTFIEFTFKTIPERRDQRGGYSYRGKAEVTFTSCALNDDELKVFKKELEQDDIGDAYKMIGGATDESLGQLKDDLKDLLGEEEKEKEQKKEEDINPFSTMFSFLFNTSKETKEKETNSIPKDDEYEKVIRSQAILEARWKCRRLYDNYKKAHEMLSFPPTRF